MFASGTPRRLVRRSYGIIAIAVGALCMLAGRASAQNGTLTLSGATITFAAPTAADYIAGFKNSATGVLFTYDATGGGGSRTTAILIRSSSANMGGGKVIGDLQWRRSDLATWNNITTTNVLVESRSVVRDGLNDPWSNTIFFRILLNWATDAPATYSATYVITLSQTAP
jgi:hypothetical protein